MINYYYLPGVRVFLTIQLIFQLNFRFVLNYTENLCITITGRSYLIRWKNYSQEWDSWVPRTNLHPEMIREYEMQSNSYVFNFNWPHRCPQCDLPCASARGVRIHSAPANSRETSRFQRQTG